MPRPPPPAAALTATGYCPRRGHGGLDVGHRAVRARDHRHAGLRRRLARGRLVAHQLDVLGLRADEPQSGAFDAGELGVFGVESVTGVNGFGARLARRAQDGLAVQIRLGTAEIHGVVGHPHVRRARVRLRVDGDGLEPEVAARPDDPDRDLPGGGDQDQEPSSMTATAWPAWTASSLPTRNSTSVPPTSASTSWKFFMISTSPIVAPADTVSPSSQNGSESGSGRR